MKKLVFLFVAVAAISFASCGGQTAKVAEADSATVAAQDSITEIVDSIDSVVVDSVVAE
jgi:hypothetical protein